MIKERIRKCLPLVNHTLCHLILRCFLTVNKVKLRIAYLSFVDHCLSFCPFSFAHCVVCTPSIYGFWLPFGIFKLFCKFIYWLQLTHKTKVGVTRTPLATGVRLMCSGRVSSSCSTSGTRRIILVKNGKVWKAGDASGSSVGRVLETVIKTIYLKIIYLLNIYDISLSGD
jgi:hypothetical protein